MTTTRQLTILQYLAMHGEAEVKDLSDHLRVSPSTIRRELSAMEGSGLLLRTHGAARVHSPISYDAPYEKRAADHIEEKRRIGAAALSLVRPGQVIGIMGGTTCTEFARQLRAMGGITVVTNALNIPLELQGGPPKRVLVTGGFQNTGSYELVGMQALQSLANTHLDLAFLGASGITADFGFSHSDESEAAVARAFKSAAERTIVLADSSKLGRATFARLGPLSDVDCLITDTHATPEQVKALRKAGLEVRIAGS